MIVIDASAAVDFLVRNDDRGRWLADRLAQEFTVHVPALFDLEVLQSLRGLEAGRAVPTGVLAGALTGLIELRATRHHHEQLRGRIWSLRHNLTAYDAAYVALAEALDAPLITTDVALSRASVHEARVEMPPV